MNQARLNQDLRLLIGLYDSPNSQDKNVRWNRERIQIERVPIPQHIVHPQNPNRRFCRVSIPIPANLYEPAGRGMFHYYPNLLVEAGFRWRQNGRLTAIPRVTAYERPGEPFAWVCLHMNTCGPRTTVESLVRALQRFLAAPR